MKKILSPLIIIFIVLMLLINYKATIKPNQSLAISQKTRYSVMQDEVFTLEVDLFFNKENLLINKEAVAYLYIADQNQTKKIVANTFEITYLAKRNFIGQSFEKHRFSLSFKDLSSDFHINESYLTIVLKNDEVYHFYIGEVSFLSNQRNENESHLYVKDLYGLSDDLNEQSLSEVVITIDPKETITIKRITMNHYDWIDPNEVITTERTFTIKIQLSDLIYQRSAIRIEYVHQGNTYSSSIDGFLFFDFKAKSETLGEVNTIYELN
ncbi:MAG TPA: hypothetical protein DEA45_01055 [Acholeplasmataceae bacterium]|nr:hypothetical protein [Acholeplasmataceae bacterium]